MEKKDVDKELKEIEEFVQAFSKFFQLAEENPEEYMNRVKDYLQSVRELDAKEQMALSKAINIWVK